MSLKALDNDKAYHADLALRAQAAKGTTAMLHLARFYGKLEKSRDYDRDKVYSALREAKTSEEIDAVLADAEVELPDASSGTRRKWKKAADRVRASLG